MKPSGMSSGIWYWSFKCSYRALSFQDWWDRNPKFPRCAKFAAQKAWEAARTTKPGTN